MVTKELVWIELFLAFAVLVTATATNNLQMVSLGTALMAANIGILIVLNE